MSNIFFLTLFCLMPVIEHDEYEIDQSTRMYDRIAPGIPSIQSSSIRRGTIERPFISQEDSDIGRFDINILAAKDNSTPMSDMGVRFYVHGSNIEFNPFPEYPIKLFGQNSFLFKDKVNIDREPIHIEISIATVDRAGNFSEQSERYLITDGITLGCNLFNKGEPIWFCPLIYIIFLKRRCITKRCSGTAGPQ